MASEYHVIDNSLVQQHSYLDEAGHSRDHAKDRHVYALLLYLLLLLLIVDVVSTFATS